MYVQYVFEYVLSVCSFLSSPSVNSFLWIWHHWTQVSSMMYACFNLAHTVVTVSLMKLNLYTEITFKLKSSGSVTFPWTPPTTTEKSSKMAKLSAGGWPWLWVLWAVRGEKLTPTSMKSSFKAPGCGTYGCSIFKNLSFNTWGNCRGTSAALWARSPVGNGPQGPVSRWQGPNCSEGGAGHVGDAPGGCCTVSQRIQAGEELKLKHHWIFHQLHGKSRLFWKCERFVSNGGLEMCRRTESSMSNQTNS